MPSLRRTVSIAVLVLAAGLAAPLHADELRGVALVIGASDYEVLDDLANPVGDARAMDDMLGDLGFDVTRVLDRNGDRLREEIADFVADAQGADVALVYYAGHAVEAGGQNYLVPVDADLATPVTAGASLVPIGELLNELARTVPVTIMLLDACRTEAFPGGTAVLLPGGDVPVAVAATGLTEMRGPTAVLTNIDPESLGMVIGFAASPGAAALDGPAGSNSPYAAALLKHLSAGGYEFGDLMTMVTEEVYLETGGRQLPWINSSLRRALSFGAPLVETDSDENLIASARRTLLLSISTMPDYLKHQVEAAATEASVPMDAIYGLLSALGEDVPSDPTDLQKLILTQVDRITETIRDQAAISSVDPEITRLADLADRAIGEGAMAVAVQFLEAAKARYATVDAALDEAEGKIEARRIEGGELFAKSANAYSLAGDYRAAAENYRLAFAEVEKWDDRLALLYKARQAEELYAYGDQYGDNAILLDSIAAIREALALASREADPSGWATLQSKLGGALAILGERRGDNGQLEASLSAYRLALEASPRDRVPLDWAGLQNNIANVLGTLGEQSGDAALLEEAVATYRLVLEHYTREQAPLEWAMTQNNLGATLSALGRHERSSDRLEEALAAYRLSLEVRTRERLPIEWAATLSNLGSVLSDLGRRDGRVDRFESAVAAYRLALEERTREREPLAWALTQNNLGDALEELGRREGDTGRLEEALAAYRLALEEYTRERVPVEWASTQINIGNALRAIGNRSGGTAELKEAANSYRLALEELTRARTPLEWATAQNDLGNVLGDLGRRENNPQRLEDAISAYRAALLEHTRARVPFEWALTQNNLGATLVRLGRMEASNTHIDAGVTAYRLALEEFSAEDAPLDWARTQNNLAAALVTLGETEAGTGRLEEAIVAYRHALQQRRRETVPRDWISSSSGLGDALRMLGERIGSRELLEEARTVLITTRDFSREGGYDFDRDFADLIAKANAALYALR